MMTGSNDRSRADRPNSSDANRADTIAAVGSDLADPAARYLGEAFLQP